MELDIKLSINKREEYNHNTFLLKWRSYHSDYTMKEFNRDMLKWSKGDWSESFNWGIHDHQRPRKGDRFFFIHIGREKSGIFAAGRFAENPHHVDDWMETWCLEHAVELEFETVFHPECSEIITTEELEQEFPNYKWSISNAEELLDRECAERLELVWRDFVGRNKSLYLPRAVKNENYDSRSEIDKAIELASKAHAADYDLDGNPTILHPLAVGMMGRNDTERIVGFLHDVVEDTQYSFEDLIEMGFSKVVIETLRLLTHDKETPYMEYIKRICKSKNSAAINVKLNDLKHNLARGKEGGHLRCVEKHTEALAFIESSLNNQTR